MLASADAALEAVEFARAEPRGALRVSCPVALAQWGLSALVPEFFAKYPGVRLQLVVANRRVDVVSEGFDVALRVRSQPSGEDGLVMRSFGESDELLVASPAYLARAGRPIEPQQLAEAEILDYAQELGRHLWELRGPDGRSERIELSPRLACHDFVVLHAAALAGLGIARLPEQVVRADLAGGTLERVLPAWNTPQGILHIVFPSRRGLLPAVRAFIDFLAERLPEQMRAPAEGPSDSL
jgi:DNA-binding transcriptional LysR family regulator